MELKSLNEINHTFNEELTAKTRNKPQAQNPRTSLFRVMSDILFYLVILVVLYSVLTVDQSSNHTRNIMGFSCFTVMSSSMKNEIPKGSFIITRHTDPAHLNVGDNISFTKAGNTIITHKIIEIIEDEPGTNGRCFRTKGVNNVNPDDYITAEADILGKVILVLPGVGNKVNSVSENIHIILFIFLICTIISFLLRGIFVKKNKDADSIQDESINWRQQDE